MGFLRTAPEISIVIHKSGEIHNHTNTHSEQLWNVAVILYFFSCGQFVYSWTTSTQREQLVAIHFPKMIT